MQQKLWEQVGQARNRNTSTYFQEHWGFYSELTLHIVVQN